MGILNQNSIDAKLHPVRLRYTTAGCHSLVKHCNKCPSEQEASSDVQIRESLFTCVKCLLNPGQMEQDGPLFYCLRIISLFFLVVLETTGTA